MEVGKKKISRPLSPFLSIYKPQFGSMISIMGRISGIVLSAFMFVYLFLLYGKDSLLNDHNFYTLYFYFFNGSFENYIVSSCFLFMLVNLVYHVCFSVRFLNWAYNLKGKDLPLNLDGLYESTLIILFCTLWISLSIWLLI